MRRSHIKKYGGAKGFSLTLNGKIDLRALHVMVYDANNVALALRQLSQSSGKMALGADKTNLKMGIHVRYADDILVLCKKYEDAVKFKFSVTRYLTGYMRLEINEDRAKIYDLTCEKMKYLGYDFYVFKQPTKNAKKKGKYMVANTLPQSKEDEIVKRCGVLLHNIKHI